MTWTITNNIISPIMPPLLLEEKIILADVNYSGISCQSFVSGYLAMKGINVAEPKVDTGVDLLVEKEPKMWLAAQVKKVIFDPQKNVHGSPLNSFRLNFQNDKQNMSVNKIDLYYHVLLTHQRVMIWEVNAEHIPTREDGYFIKNTHIVLDRSKHVCRETNFQKNLKLVYEMYSPQVIENNQLFFV